MNLGQKNPSEESELEAQRTNSEFGVEVLVSVRPDDDSEHLRLRLVAWRESLSRSDGISLPHMALIWGCIS